MIKRLLWVLVIIFSMTLASCEKKNYPDPTFRYYVNDYAESLMQYTERLVTAQNEFLYESYGEIQIVYAVFFVKDIAEIGNYDRVEIFKQWKPGNKDTDMGLLVIIFVSDVVIGGDTYKEIVGAQIEPGYGLEEYLTPTEMNTLRDDYLLSDTHYGIVDMQLMQFQYELLNSLYSSVYNEDPISYDMDEFYTQMMNAPYIPENMGSTNMFGVFLNMISVFGSNLSAVWIITSILSILGGGLGFTIFKVRGGGGRSGGRGI